MDYIKNSDLILSDTLDGNIRTIVLKERSDKIKLSEVFNCLPHGIVIKDETGMGATTLELTAARPSIIVEPLRVTAMSKADKHKAIYYGSKSTNETRQKDKQIIEALREQPPEKRKIVVVADSLGKVKNMLGTSFKEYFLLIDEADSFQLDSTFRDSMSKCMDIYKEQPLEKRAMVTATPLAFSDPGLKDEAILIIRYNVPQVRKIKLYHSANHSGVVIDAIKKTISQKPDSKIMVAYNCVAGCLDIAKHLVKNESIPEHNIKILCSASGKDRVKGYFHALETDKLPAQINFITSAYFTGFDLHEDYHLISISDSTNPIFLLSEKRLKQIAGRCRQSLLSETIVYNASASTNEIATAGEMIGAAEKEILALRCISSNFDTNPLLKHNLLKIRELIINNTRHEGTQFLRHDIHKNPVVNYLSIDAALEAHRVKKDLYNSQNQLPVLLKKEGHTVEVLSSDSKLKVEKNVPDKIEKQSVVDGIIQKITGMSIGELRDWKKDLDRTQPESKIANYYLDNIKYLDEADVIKILKALGKRDRKEFNNMAISAHFFTLNDKTNFKVQVFRHLPLGSTFTRKKLIEIWKQILSESSLQIKLEYNETSIVRWTKLFFETIKDRTSHDIKLKAHNPKGFKLKKQREDVNEKPYFYDIFS